MQETIINKKENKSIRTFVGVDDYERPGFPDKDPFSPLLRRITSEVDFSEHELRLVKESFRVKTLKKKEYILRSGEMSNYLNFVSEGVLRAYAIEGSREVIIQFGVGGACVNDLDSFLNRKSATQFIQALEPSIVLQIHSAKLKALVDEVPPFERFLRIKFEQAHINLQERFLRSISHTAKERYDQFRAEFPDLEQRVPLYMIASYLGITKEFLSHIRKRVPRGPIEI